MTTEQQQWVDTMRAAAKQKPARGVRPPSDCARRVLFDLVTSSTFDGLVMSVIVANVALMACDYWGMDRQPRVLDAFNGALRTFGHIYYAEAVLKLLALGPGGYFRDGWCRFDFFLVCASAFDEFASEHITLPVPPFMLRMLRLARILRILRLLKGAKELRDLIVTMVLSFPSLINVASLLGIVVFMYSVLGVELFTFLASADNINDVRNFHDLRSSALLLFQVLTGDAWSGLMTDAMLDERSGLCSAAAGDCGSWVAIPYFITFMLLGTFVFLNLIVAVVLENFTSLGSQRADLVSPADIETFKEAWALLDPDADNFIPSTDLLSLVLAVPPPMGLRGSKRGTRAHGLRLCLHLNVRQQEGHVAFHDVLAALVKHSYHASDSIDATGLAALETTPLEEPLPSSPPLPSSKTKATVLGSAVLGTVVLPEGALKTRGKRNLSAELRAKIEAEEFALDQPSARRVFAIQVISSRALAWAQRRREAAKERARLERQQRPPVSCSAGAQPYEPSSRLPCGRGKPPTPNGTDRSLRGAVASKPARSATTVLASGAGNGSNGAGRPSSPPLTDTVCYAHGYAGARPIHGQSGIPASPEAQFNASVQGAAASIMADAWRVTTLKTALEGLGQAPTATTAAAVTSPPRHAPRALARDPSPQAQTRVRATRSNRTAREATCKHKR